VDEADDSAGPSASDLEELKAQYVEALRAHLKWVPKWQRKSFRKDFLQVLICAGWNPEEASRVVNDALP
jgi:hypothetical protein